MKEGGEMLNEICAEIKNYFCKESDRIIGDFEIVDGCISPSLPIVNGQYYRIVGSVFNDGVHLSSDRLYDEGKFHGAVWLMRVPKEIVELDMEIEKWNEDYATVLRSPYTSESFGGYSYTKQSGSGGNGSGGGSLVWQDVFGSRLNKYRRFRVL